MGKLGGILASLLDSIEQDGYYTCIVLQNHAPRLGVTPPKILIRSQQKRWASCDHQGCIRFNWRIVMAPLSLVDYVVAHELCHLIRHDHSPAFWKLVRILLPDYEERQERLRREGSRFWF